MNATVEKSGFGRVGRRLAAAAVLLGVSLAVAQQKIPIKSADDLPRHEYQVEGKVSELLQAEKPFMELARQVRADVEADLEKYQIEDRSTLQQLYGVLLSVDLLEGRFDSALRNIERIRELETKEGQKLTTGLVTGSYVEARQQAGEDQAKLRVLFAQRLEKKLRGLPWEQVGDIIEQTKGRMEILSTSLMIGMVQSSVDPILDKTDGKIDGDIARSAVSMGVTMRVQLPLKQEIIDVYGRVIDEHRVEKKDIWAARDVQLGHDEGDSIVIGIWDSGVDPNVFKGRLYVNAGEKPDGQDNDGNGFIDDVHGVSFDLDARYSPELLQPLDTLNAKEEQIRRHMKGFMDLQAAIDSPEATAVKRELSGLQGDEVRKFMEDLGLYGLYAHGTHVAGIALEGNPLARILIARLTFDWRMMPMKPTMEWVEREAASFQQTVDYLKLHEARVVNMSWGHVQEEIEGPLQKHGVGATAEERAEIARQMFKVQREGLYKALKSAPEILFVVAAGNEDNDVEFDEFIPSSFDLPNVLVVGAVDQAGDPTDFTSFGRTVQVYANGFEVDSFMPGGERMKLSGTSMAAPNVTNLAAKVLALKPGLKPTEVIELIKAGADRVEGTRPMLLINPQRTVALARK